MASAWRIRIFSAALEFFPCVFGVISLGFPAFFRMAEKHYRSLVKAISWRLTGSLDTLVISFLVTRKLSLAFTISGIEVFTKIFLYYLHERVWHKITWGSTHLNPK
jgi:uncharacterized membrane protein